MKRIVLIGCVSRKGQTKARARELYKGPLFTKSLAYAYKLKADDIFILSALHHLVSLEKEIEPYNVTLAYVSPKKRARNPALKMLTRQEARIWGKKVLEQLNKVADLKNDGFIVLAGKSYVEPIREGLAKIDEPMKGLRQGERIRFLSDRL